MTAPASFVAVDLGASSGRVFAVGVGDDSLEFQEVGRFPTEVVRVGPLLQWDILGLYRGVLNGLRSAARRTTVASVGIDSWAVDYGLVRADGSLLGVPVTYRDPRTAAAFSDLVGEIGAPELYRRTGIALQRFNTLYQLATDARAGRLRDAEHALLVPDLLGYFLTGRMLTEETNASTTQLLGLDGVWDAGLLAAAGVPEGLFAPLSQPGEPLGPLSRDIAGELGLAEAPVVTLTASHDTAAAVAAVPAASPDFAYISCGTWSLVGVELPAPVVSEDARLAGFTNERGVGGTTRFLRNVMGLWLLQESIRTWRRAGLEPDTASLVAAAAEVEALRFVVDPDTDEFLGPGDMPARIIGACRRSGQPEPSTPEEVTRCILDSLAVAYRRALRSATELSGSKVEVLHVVGGGSNNRLLCQLTADACGVPVAAGPAEAAALGNALIQARSIGALPPDAWAIRRFVAANTQLRRYEPRPAMTERYAEAAARLESIASSAG